MSNCPIFLIGDFPFFNRLSIAASRVFARIFALALLTAYLVMSATFNSFIHPFIIILTVPLAVFGGLIFILFLNSSINIFSQIALVILIGISTKNSILIVDYANQLRTKGKEIEKAVKEACSLRFRPIIMTSLSTVSYTHLTLPTKA